MTAALKGGEWSAARPGRTLPPGKTRYPFYRRLGRSQGRRSGRAENLVPTGIRSRTVQPGSSVSIPTELPGQIYKNYRKCVIYNKSIRTVQDRNLKFVTMVSLFLNVVGLDSSVGLATRYGLDGPRIESRRGEIFRAGLGAHPPSYTMSTGSFPGLIRTGHGFDYPSHLAPRLKKE